MKQIPENVERFEGELGTYWFDENGILCSVSNKILRTLDNVKSNINLIKKISNNTPVCILVYLSRSPQPDKQTRDFVAQQLSSIYKAMAIVSNSSLGSFVINFIFKFQKPSIPMRTFSNEEDAKEWLKQYL
ncbi:SpoIIAA family protein [Solitalea canadensis]|uniref:DUF7793 domain-containing protein n=1 Tax=Solitalea canadensis (strain ATCC 29591 / DSM 3403 / JCM 21819 / LMG 8368 / NBRC 15130 / NCIMB 12057 / USAM 9D) TaxID=929556 RepID=H8KM22_SOLCM|nr:STAS/SEC14 domain-containing protein [Solitalea canadensis]AFD08944.1 hypothetical protein Solca_3949 [Solitalea canadensis DSM 3403]